MAGKQSPKKKSKAKPKTKPKSKIKPKAKKKTASAVKSRAQKRVKKATGKIRIKRSSETALSRVVKYLSLPLLILFIWQSVQQLFNDTGTAEPMNILPIASHNRGSISNIMDNVLGTRWTTRRRQVGNEWLFFDFGKAKRLNRIVLDSGSYINDYAHGVLIEGSTDRTVYTTLYADTEPPQSSRQIYALPQAKAVRYLRIRQTGSSKFWWTIGTCTFYFRGQFDSIWPVFLYYLLFVLNLLLLVYYLYTGKLQAFFNKTAGVIKKNILLRPALLLKSFKRYKKAVRNFFSFKWVKRNTVKKRWTELRKKKLRKIPEKIRYWLTHHPVHAAAVLLFTAAFMLYLRVCLDDSRYIQQDVFYLLSLVLMPLMWLLYRTQKRQTPLPGPTGIWLPASFRKTAAFTPALRWELLIAGLVIGLGVFLRFFKIETLPPGVWIDEIHAASNALRIIDKPGYVPLLGTLPLVEKWPHWVHTSNFYTYFIVVIFKVIGVSHFSIKLVSALPSSLTIIAVYWLLRELSGFKLALLGAALFSFNRWHLMSSRCDWDVLFLVMLCTLALAAICRGLRTHKHYWVVLGGMAAGLMQFTYVASRLLGAAIFVWLGLLMVLGQSSVPGLRKRLILVFLVFSFSFTITAAPVIVFSVHKNPGAALSRINQVGIIDLKHMRFRQNVFWKNTKRYLQAFYKRGPEIARQNIPHMPYLQPMVFYLAVLGFLIHLFFRRGFGQLMSVPIFFIALLNGILTRGNGIASLRIVFCAVIICLWAAHSLLLFWCYLEKELKQKWIPIAAVALILIGTSVYNTHLFYTVWAKSPETKTSLGLSYEVALCKMLQKYKYTHTILISRHIFANKEPMDVYLWTPRHIKDGEERGGLDNPVYQDVIPQNLKRYLGTLKHRPVLLIIRNSRRSYYKRRYTLDDWTELKHPWFHNVAMTEILPAKQKPAL